MARLSVVIPTYLHPEGVERLTRQLAAQTLTEAFEVVVVDDGSPQQAVARLQALRPPFELRVLSQKNAGAAAARQTGGRAARGEIIVFLDDDMEIEPDFLAQHLKLHEQGRVAVQGRIDPDPSPHKPLFDRYHADRLAMRWRMLASGQPLRGTHFCSGNLSVRSADFQAVGGFDTELPRSEDADFGLRLEKAGVKLVFGDKARSVHRSIHGSVRKWLAGALRYGETELAVARKQSWATHADPFRYLFLLGARGPVLATMAMFPRATMPIPPALVVAGQALDTAGLHSAGVHVTGLAYSTQVYRGMGQSLGSARAVVSALRGFLGKAARHPDPDAPVRKVLTAAERALEDFAADLDANRNGEAKYGPKGGKKRFAPVVIEKVGLQIALGMRTMRFFRDAGFPIGARITSRLVRHLYGCDVHWDADIGPGLCVAHGMGMAIAAGTKLGPGCIVSHGVSLGMGTAPSGERGAPILEADVHVGPGATIIGPVTIGAGTKVMPGAVVTDSVPARSIVETPKPTIRPRKPLAVAASAS